MKSPHIVSLLALVVSAVGVAAVLMGPSNFWSRHDVSADLPTRPGGLADELNDRLTIPELRPAYLQRAAVADGLVSGGGEDSPPEESPKAATLAELQDFREYAASALSEIRHQEATDKLRTLEERAARLDETMTALEDWLELTPHQSDKMRSLLLSRFDREAEYLRLWEEGADEEIRGELKVNDREAQVSELSGFLTAGQLETYLSRGGGGGK